MSLTSLDLAGSVRDSYAVVVWASHAAAVRTETCVHLFWLTRPPVVVVVV